MDLFVDGAASSEGLDGHQTLRPTTLELEIECLTPSSSPRQ